MTSSGTEHTLKAFDSDIGEVRGLISDMGARAESAITQSVTALLRHDMELAKTVITGDKTIDRLEAEVEAKVVQTIALRAPMADDLRELVAALKISSMIERIGDYAKNIAKRIAMIEDASFIKDNDQLLPMSKIAAEMVRDTMDAFARRDTELAVAVCDRDRSVDQLHNNIFVDLVAHVAKHPEQAEQIAHLLFVSKNLERIGDHATNTAEMVYFTAEGTHMPEREKGERLGIKRTD